MHPYSEGRRSRRLSKQSSVSYDAQGWESVDPPHSEISVLEAPSPASSVSSYSSTPSNPRRRSKLNHVPRPPNAFMLFRSEFWKQNKNTIAQRDHREISRMCGVQWNSLPAHEKAHFKSLAQVEKERHLLKYPDYKYAPASRISKSQGKKTKKETEDEESRCRNLAAMMMRDVRGSEQTLQVYDESLFPPTPIEPSPSPVPSDVYQTSLRSAVYSPNAYTPFQEPQFVPTHQIPSLELDTSPSSSSTHPFALHGPILTSGDDPTLTQISGQDDGVFTWFPPKGEYTESLTPATGSSTFNYDTTFQSDYSMSAYGSELPYNSQSFTESNQTYDATFAIPWSFESMAPTDYDYGSIPEFLSSSQHLFPFSYDAESPRRDL